MLGSAVVPDRTTLEKEADEFEQYMLKKREETLARGENGSTKVLFAIKIAKTH